MPRGAGAVPGATDASGPRDATLREDEQQSVRTSLTRQDRVSCPHLFNIIWASPPHSEQHPHLLPACSSLQAFACAVPLPPSFKVQLLSFLSQAPSQTDLSFFPPRLLLQRSPSSGLG